MATALLPVPFVQEAIDNIVHEADDAEKLAFLQYFVHEWLVQFPIPQWNVHGLEVRTNNAIEGYHHRLNRKAGFRHLSAWELIALLRDEQSHFHVLAVQVDLSSNKISKKFLYVFVLLSQVLVAQTPGRRIAKYLRLNQRLETLRNQLQRGMAIDDYLRAIQYNIAELGDYYFAHEAAIAPPEPESDISSGDADN